MALCKFHSHHQICQYETKFGECRQTHAPTVRDAPDYLVACEEEGQSANQEKLRKILNPGGNLTYYHMECLRSLLTRYPKPPTEEEIRRNNGDSEREKIDEAFQELFGNVDIGGR